MTFDETLKYLKNNYQYLNYENDNILKKLKKIYNKKTKISKSKLIRYYRKEFNFKYSQKSNIKFWLERGFDENYSNKEIQKISNKISKKMKIIKKNNRNNFLNYNDAKNYIQKLNINTKNEYIKISSKKSNLPSNPDKFYTEWCDWGTYLRNKATRNSIKMFSYEECKKYISKYNIKSKTHYFKEIKKLIKENNKIPYNPQNYYKNDWISWGDFLKTNRIQDNKRKFLSYKDTILFLKKYNITSIQEWKDFCKNKPDFIHSNPRKKYKEFKNMSDFLNLKSKYTYGEKTIKKILDNLNIKYIYQHKFEKCKDKRELPFDFYLPKYKLCVEYDGKQHFESIEFFGGEKAFKTRQKHDQIKNIFCKDNHINLLRIKYNEKIDEKIKKVIEYYQSLS